jgi:zeta-carotene desaturase
MSPRIGLGDKRRTFLQDSSSALILGGGLAGIAAAVRLAQAGVPVTLIETRKRLGGRATSFVDPTTREVLDNCQHVLLGCCTNLIDLYRRLGVADKIEWHSRLHFHLLRGDGSSVIDTMEADDLPAPLHMTRALLGFRSLTLREKVAISRGMLAMMRLGKAGRAAQHHKSFRGWLVEHDQPRGAIDKFWSVVVIGAVNELPERMAADYAIQVFQEAFLANEGAYVMGLSRVPLVELYDAAERVIERSGGRVLLSRSVERLEFDGRRVTGVELDRAERLLADAVVSALPFDRLAKICSPELRAADARLQRLNELRVSPILGVHLWFRAFEGNGEHPVMTLPHLILMNSPLQWIFNKGFERDPANGLLEQHLHGVISAAHDLVDEPAERIIDTAVTEVRKTLPAARSAAVIHARVVKEKRATFSAAPGVDAIRPEASGAVSNLYLAGDWCRTGWPATMEGATRSGYLAAAALRADHASSDNPPLVNDLTPSALYSIIAR